MPVPDRLGGGADSMVNCLEGLVGDEDCSLTDLTCDPDLGLGLGVMVDNVEMAEVEEDEERGGGWIESVGDAGLRCRLFLDPEESESRCCSSEGEVRFLDWCVDERDEEEGPLFASCDPDCRGYEETGAGCKRTVVGW